MHRDSRIFLRRLTGFCLWWLSFLQGLSIHLTLEFIIVSATTLLCWCATFIRRSTPYRIAAICYIVGLLAMLYLTAGHWLFNGVIWGVYLTLSLFLIAFLRALDRIQTKSASKISEMPQPQKESLPLRYFVIYYFFWFIGLILIALNPGQWQITIAIAWTCIMLILGSQSIWPLAAYPEWLGYNMRRKIFITKQRWFLKFLITGLLLTICIVCIFLFVRF